MIQFFYDPINLMMITRLSVAVGLGLFIGAERLFVHKEAGMKTHALVALGAALFIIISEMLANLYGASVDPTRIASQIIVGIGFLGAGSIMLQGSHLSGLTTAGGLWVTAGIGMAAGFGLFGLAVITSVLVFIVLTAVNILEVPLRKFVDEKKEQR